MKEKCEDIKGNQKRLIKEGQILLWQKERDKMINDGWQYPTQKTNDWATQNPVIKRGMNSGAQHG